MVCFSFVNTTCPLIGYPIYRQGLGICNQGLLMYQKHVPAQYLNTYDDSLSNDRMSYLQLPSQPSEVTANLLKALQNSAATLDSQASYTKKCKKNVKILQDLKNNIKTFVYKQILHPCYSIQVFSNYTNCCVFAN